MVESRWKTPVGKRGPLNVNVRCETHRGRDGVEEEPDGRGDGGGGTARGLRIGGWNIHGWRRNRGEALRAIEELGLDVLVVSEPWLKGAGRVCGFKWVEYVEAGGRRAKVVMLVRNGVEAVLMKGSTRRMVWVKLCDKNNKGVGRYYHTPCVSDRRCVWVLQWERGSEGEGVVGPVRSND